MSEEMIAVNKERYKKILKRYEELYNQNLRLKKELQKRKEKEVPEKLFELKEEIATLGKELDKVKKDNEQYRQVFENLKSSDDVALPDFSETVKKIIGLEKK